MTTPTITGLDARLLTRSLVRPWGDTVREMHVVEVVLRASDGSTGTGFSWTPTIGPTAILALLERDIRRFVVGRPADASTLWPDLWVHLHEDLVLAHELDDLTDVGSWLVQQLKLLPQHADYLRVRRLSQDTKSGERCPERNL